MAVVQSTYSENMTEAVVGMIGNMVPHSVDTCVVETVAGIAFGLVAGQGSAEKGCVLGAAAATGFRGITVRDVTRPPGDSDKYSEGSNAALLTRGDIWVSPGGAVTAGNDVSFHKTTGRLYTTAPDGTYFAIAGARWMTSAAQDGIALLRLSSGALPVT